MKPNKLHLSVVLASVICTFSSAQIIDLQYNNYRDYLDLGQNKGAFAAPNESVSIKQKNGEILTFHKIPDQSARSNYGTVTSLGRNYVVTAKHLDLIFDAKNVGNTKGAFRQTTYNFLSGYHNTFNSIRHFGRDTIYLRTDKYIVEGNIDPLDIAGLDASGTPNNSQPEQSVYKNLKLIDDYIKQVQDKDTNPSDNKIEAYQAGVGVLGFRHGKGDKEARDLQNNTIGGSFNYISFIVQNIKKIVLAQKVCNQG
ncbi:S6 family peptidase [Campylobacter suis]|uniref:Peptidase S6 domain-containing protein n=1 Tax=Campylobacter suis TaxID=2790657 RepID=A0ABM8Q999_9BACT|nr:hypothetical protein [Campylobacter suis]CAD7289343.1 hypothetical protein LMG8286_01773 [Campylobacter suis]